MGEYYNNFFGSIRNLDSISDITKYNLFRGVTDWSALEQFNLFEQGYPMLVCVGIPEFIRRWGMIDPEIKKLTELYCHILEYEFLGFDSWIDNIQSETATIENGSQSINVINKVTGPSGVSFGMTYKEKAGAPLTKMHEFYLRGIKDPTTQYKTYNGLVVFDDDKRKAELNNVYYTPDETGFDQECFTFLAIFTDNTGIALEDAVLLCCCQPTSANIGDMYNAKRGEPNFYDISLEFNGVALRSSAVNARALKILQNITLRNDNLRNIRNSWTYDYSALKNPYGLGNESVGLKYTEMSKDSNAVNTGEVGTNGSETIDQTATAMDGATDHRLKASR